MRSRPLPLRPLPTSPQTQLLICHDTQLDSSNRLKYLSVPTAHLLLYPQRYSARQQQALELAAQTASCASSGPQRSWHWEKNHAGARKANRQLAIGNRKFSIFRISRSRALVQASRDSRRNPRANKLPARSPGSAPDNKSGMLPGTGRRTCSAKCRR